MHSSPIYYTLLSCISFLGVNRCQIVALTENAPETYQNMKIILQLLQLEKLSHVDASDLKLTNTLLGLSVSKIDMKIFFSKVP